jgi:hypothetical protein
MPVDRLVGVDHVDPRLPQSVIDASTGTSVADLAAGTHTHTKTEVGLANVDNTADASKPVSADQAAADALKLNLTGGTLTGSLIMHSTISVRNVGGLTTYGTVTGASMGGSNAIQLVNSNGTAILGVTAAEVRSTVPVLLPGNPTSALHAAPMQYVDASRTAARTFSAAGVALTAQAVTTETTVVTLTIPAQLIAASVYLSALIRFDKTVATDGHIVRIRDGGTEVASWYSGAGTVNNSASLHCVIAAPASTARTITATIIRGTGTGTISTFADVVTDRVDALWFPT